MRMFGQKSDFVYNVKACKSYPHIMVCYKGGVGDFRPFQMGGQLVVRLRALEFKSEDHGFDPLVGQGEG